MQSPKAHQIAAQLASYELPSLEILQEAVVAGEQQRVSCTSLDAPTFPGLSAWGISVRRLRELLKPHGWKPKNVNNLPLVVDPLKKIGIAVTAGTDGVGKSDRYPTTKQDKGPVFEGLVKTNRSQLNLFGDNRQLMQIPEAGDITTWLLLVFTEYKPRNEKEGDHVAFCELSLPAEVDDRGYVSKWAERIILPPVRIDEIPVATDDDFEEDDLDVPVTRLN